MSRVALLLAITEKHSFEISPWQNLTFDWAKTPDDRYFSNKAPGPSLLAAPLFAALYKPLNRITETHFNDPTKIELAWMNTMSFIMWIISIVFQIVPLGWVIARLAILMKTEKTPESGILFFIAASMFGNTGAFFMNSYFGHGYAIVTNLMVMLFLLKDQWLATGLFLGLAILGDYSSSLLLPMVGLMSLDRGRDKSWQNSLYLIKGLSIPLALFAFYHWHCFGGITALPQKFQNPIFVDNHNSFENFGVISWLPKPLIIRSLLFGRTRGVLFTQPYILVLSIALISQVLKNFKAIHALTKTDVISLISWTYFGGLLWMNAGFNGWHGGSTPGPRYLVAAFPLMALAGALNWNAYGRQLRKVLWLLLGLSVLFFTIVLAAGENPHPSQTLFAFYGDVFLGLSDSPQFWYRWIAILIALGFVSWTEIKSRRIKI